MLKLQKLSSLYYRMGYTWMHMLAHITLCGSALNVHYTTQHSPTTIQYYTIHYTILYVCLVVVVVVVIVVVTFI